QATEIALERGDEVEGAHSGLEVDTDLVHVHQPIIYRQPPVSEIGYADIDALFDKRFDARLAPGLVYAVVGDGEIVHSAAFGSVSPGADDAPTVDSVFRIASMSKSFTAAALLLLRDRGALRLDD